MYLTCLKPIENSEWFSTDIEGYLDVTILKYEGEEELYCVILGGSDDLDISYDFNTREEALVGFNLLLSFDAIEVEVASEMLKNLGGKLI